MVRKSYSKELKARIALDAIEGQKTIADLMSEYSYWTIDLSLRETNNVSQFLTLLSKIWNCFISLKSEMRSFRILDLKWKWIADFDLFGTECVYVMMQS